MVRVVTPEQLVLPDAAPALPSEPPPIRKVLPPYGRPLLQARRQGVHPRVVGVVFGDDWRGAQRPFLAVSPARFVPGRYDWRVVAGVNVVLFDRAGAVAGGDCQDDFFALIGELVDADAYVELRYPQGGQWVTLDPGLWAYDHRINDPQRRWPVWWSDAREARHSAAQLGVMTDMMAAIDESLERDEKK